MYSRQEAAQRKKEFWTVFGQYMTPVLSAEGERISWVNYRTGEKNIAFRLEADNKIARVAIELSHPDIAIQQLYYEQFLQIKPVFESIMTGDWRWSPQITDEYGKIISRISIEIREVSVFRKEDWPELIAFFKINMIALDEFWSNVKYGFEALR